MTFSNFLPSLDEVLSLDDDGLLAEDDQCESDGSDDDSINQQEVIPLECVESVFI